MDERALIEQLCKDLNGAHDELLLAQGCKPTETGHYDWPEWSPQANSIRAAEKLLERKLAKTDAWTLFPPWGGFCHRETCRRVTKASECPGDLRVCEGHPKGKETA